MGMEITIASRFDIFMVFLGPSQGHEVNKTRPCVIISPSEMNNSLKTLIIAPMTTMMRFYPSRIHTIFDGQRSSIMLDQIRTVDRKRLIKKLGTLDPKSSIRILDTLQAMFSA